ELDVPRVGADEERLEIEVDDLLRDRRSERGVADAHVAVVGEDLDDQPAVERERAHGRLGPREQVDGVGAEVRGQGNRLAPPLRDAGPDLLDLHGVSTFPVFSLKRTRAPRPRAALAMWAARTARWPTRMGAFGALRLRMHSSQLRRWLTEPSPSDRTCISGSGVFGEPGFRLSSLNTSRRSRSILSVPRSPRNSRPPSSMLLPYVPVCVTMKSRGYSRVAVTASGHSQVFIRQLRPVLTAVSGVSTPMYQWTTSIQLVRMSVSAP